MSILNFTVPQEAISRNKEFASEAVAEYRQKKLTNDLTEPLALGEQFTLIDDVHNPVIECNHCKTSLIFSEHATVVGMRQALQSHQCQKEDRFCQI